MFGMSRPQPAGTTRLVTKPFVAVTAATGAFFVYVGMLIPLLPRFVEDKLGAGELGVGLAIASFAAAAIAARPMIARLIDARGRRQVMTAGAVLAGVAGAASCDGRAPSSRCSCCGASPASGRRRCSSARRP